ncbi:hypothetical protein TGAMA5MH_06810 [Trichoderma gamsii]|uniref:Uncharacterized protein n=1 Tax=Trichoderma gamsii TaxID=398673 RepID=A0A2K0T5Z4_9HYPO|nr:hypothetical protein TGAMA5MH_06810 [Trichoderma gamsii]
MQVVVPNIGTNSSSSNLLVAHLLMLVALITPSLILANLPRSPLRPVLVHPGLVLEYNESAADVVVSPLQSRPSTLSEAGQPAAQHKAQYDANGHADEESSQNLLPAVAALSNVCESATLAGGRWRRR